MKRAVCLLLALLLFVCFCGCGSSESSEISESVEFFYPRKSDSFLYGTESGALGCEVRDAAGRTGDLSYLLSLYLRGPQDTALRSPFPAGCKLVDAHTDGETLCVVLSGEFTAAENMELTLACASLARTCLGLTDAQHVRIEAMSESKTISITLDSNSLLLADDSALETQSATEMP